MRGVGARRSTTRRRLHRGRERGWLVREQPEGYDVFHDRVFVSHHPDLDSVRRYIAKTPRAKERAVLEASDGYRSPLSAAGTPG